jgi:hypothetical protein
MTNSARLGALDPEGGILFLPLQLPMTADPRTGAEMACALAALRRSVMSYLRREGDALPQRAQCGLEAACEQLDATIAALASQPTVGVG